jgi:predicted RNase H-like HicB family nuclease
VEVITPPTSKKKLDNSKQRKYKKEHRMASYTGIVFKDAESDYSVHFPDLPGCITAGIDMDEALCEAMKAVASHLNFLAKESDSIPEPRSLEELLKDSEFNQDLAEGGIIIHVPALSTSSAKRRVEIQMELNLLEAIDNRAHATGITRTTFIHEASRKMLMTG